jgi:hypothetical protein
MLFLVVKETRREEPVKSPSRALGMGAASRKKSPHLYVLPKPLRQYGFRALSREGLAPMVTEDIF